MKLWIDTDCGVDDSTAIIIALQAPDTDIVGISCVAGNASLSQVVKNVNRTLEVWGKGKKNIPIYSGCSSAMLVEPKRAADVHGKEGLGEYDDRAFNFSGNIRHDTEHGSLALLKAARAEPELTVLCLGPVTNVAHAVHMDPSAFINTKFHIMGGAENLIGNVTPYAEFNVHCDPHALSILLKHIPHNHITFSTWTLTKLYPIKGDDVTEFFKQSSTLMERYFKDTWISELNFNGGFTYTADPIAAFTLCYPKSITSVIQANLSVVTKGEMLGATPITEDPNGSFIIKDFDRDAYFAVLRSILRDH